MYLFMLENRLFPNELNSSWPVTPGYFARERRRTVAVQSAQRTVRDILGGFVHRRQQRFRVSPRTATGDGRRSPLDACFFL
jgi:hypothetical protein